MLRSQPADMQNMRLFGRRLVCLQSVLVLPLCLYTRVSRYQQQDDRCLEMMISSSMIWHWQVGMESPAQVTFQLLTTCAPHSKARFQTSTALHFWGSSVIVLSRATCCFVTAEFVPPYTQLPPSPEAVAMYRRKKA